MMLANIWICKMHCHYPCSQLKCLWKHELTTIHCVRHPSPLAKQRLNKKNTKFSTLCCFSYGKWLEQSNLNANMSDRLKRKTNSSLSLSLLLWVLFSHSVWLFVNSYSECAQSTPCLQPQLPTVGYAFHTICWYFISFHNIWRFSHFPIRFISLCFSTEKTNIQRFFSLSHPHSFTSEHVAFFPLLFTHFDKEFMMENIIFWRNGSKWK